MKFILITKEKGLLKNIDIDKYNKQYHNLKVVYNNTFHDRLILLDKKEIYHLDTSLNHAGSKTFGINKIEKKVIIDSFIKHVHSISVGEQ